MNKKENFIEEELEILCRLEDTFRQSNHKGKEGKFALLYCEKLQGYFDTREDAHLSAKSLCGTSIYLVKQISHGEETIN